MPVELHVPPPLPPELPTFVDPIELPAEPLSDMRISQIAKRSHQNHRSESPDADLYSDPRRSSTRRSPNGFLHPAESRDSDTWRSGPTPAYEVSDVKAIDQTTIQRKPVGLAKKAVSHVNDIGVEGYD